MAEFLLLKVLPSDQQVVEIKIFNLPGLWTEATWNEQNQNFTINATGLIVSSNVVIMWREI